MTVSVMASFAGMGSYRGRAPLIEVFSKPNIIIALIYSERHRRFSLEIPPIVSARRPKPSPFTLPAAVAGGRRGGGRSESLLSRR